MLLLTLILILPNLFITILINTKTQNKFNPASVMFYLWTTLLLFATVLGPSWGYYPMKVSGTVLISFFLFVILSIFFIGCKKNLYICYEIAKTNSYSVCVFFILLYLFSEAMYFIKLNTFIPLNELPFRLWQWKNLLLTGTFNESSFIFLGKNLSFIGTIIAYTFINEEKKKRKIALGVLVFVYVVMAFIYPRRDVMINKLVCILIPFVFKYRNSMKHLFKILFPVALCFVLVFFYINDSLTFGEANIQRSVASYSFGAFNSLQKAIDVGYPSNSNLLFGNTFYFLYMILKYIFPQLTPPHIVLESLGTDTTNVYSALIAPVIDSNGNYFNMIIIMFLYALWIGIVLCISYNWFLKTQTMASLCLYSTAFSCVIRSFYNPTFSYSDMIFGIIYAILIMILTPPTRKKGNFVLK